MQHFLEMLRLQHLGVLHLRGRTKTGTRTIGKGLREAVGDNEEKTETRGDKEKKGVESTKEDVTSDEVRTSGNNGRFKKDKANRKKKARTWTWSNVVKGLNSEDELETANSDKSGNESEVADSFNMLNSEEPNQLKAKQTRR